MARVVEKILDGFFSECRSHMSDSEYDHIESKFEKHGKRIPFHEFELGTR